MPAPARPPAASAPTEWPAARCRITQAPDFHQQDDQRKEDERLAYVVVPRFPEFLVSGRCERERRSPSHVVGVTGDSLFQCISVQSERDRCLSAHASRLSTRSLRIIVVGSSAADGAGTDAGGGGSEPRDGVGTRDQSIAMRTAFPAAGASIAIRGASIAHCGWNTELVSLSAIIPASFFTPVRIGGDRARRLRRSPHRSVRVPICIQTVAR